MSCVGHGIPVSPSLIFFFPLFSHAYASCCCCCIIADSCLSTHLSRLPRFQPFSGRGTSDTHHRVPYSGLLSHLGCKRATAAVSLSWHSYALSLTAACNTSHHVKSGLPVLSGSPWGDKSKKTADVRVGTAEERKKSVIAFPSQEPIDRPRGREMDVPLSG